MQGFAVQGYVTGEGPYANWAKHVSDPCAPPCCPGQRLHACVQPCTLPRNGSSCA